MARVSFTDFSGGIAADGVVLNDRQVADAYGLVLDDQKRLRSQPPIDQMATDGASELSKLVVGGNTWLVRRSNEETPGFSYVKLDAASGKATPVSGIVQFEWQPIAGAFSQHHRVVGQIRFNDAGRLRPALLIHLPPQDGPVGEPNGKGYYVLENADGSALQAVEIASSYPNLTLRDNAYFAESSAVPRCSVATMWRDIPVYANIEFPGVQSNDWYRDNNFSATTAKPYSNFIYFGNATNNGWVDPRYPHRVSDDGTTIIGMFEVDEGLLCFTTGSSNASGVILLRGTPSDFTVDAVDNATNERITGLAPMQALDGEQASVLARSMSYWDEQQSVLFVTSDNRLMQYRTGRLADLSPQTAAAPPMAGRIGGSATSVAAAGRYLVFADSRQQTLWIMRSYGSEGAWTRLALPAGEPLFGSMIEADGDIYWIHVTFGEDDEALSKVCVLRLTDAESTVESGLGPASMPGVLAERRGPQSRRGEVIGAQPPLRLITRMIGDDQPNIEKWWDEVAVRVVRPSTNSATVVGVTTVFQDADQNVGSYVENINAGITRPAETVVLNAAGPATVAQFVLELKGDIVVEALTVTFEPGTESY